MEQFLSPRMLDILNHEGSDPHYEREDDLYSLGLLTVLIALRALPEELYVKDRHNRWAYNSRLIE
jgi:hypothetical protein